MNEDGEQASAPLALQHIYGEKKWWESLEWDDLHTKTSLQPFFSNSYSVLQCARHESCIPMQLSFQTVDLTELIKYFTNHTRGLFFSLGHTFTLLEQELKGRRYNIGEEDNCSSRFFIHNIQLGLS